MHHYRTLIAAVCVALLTNASAQNALCPGESLVFQVADEYYGTKTWEHSTDGVTWNPVAVIEDEPFVLQPEQSGWYRVRFHDEDCDINFISDAQRFVTHAMELGEVLTITIGGVVRNELGGPVSGAIVLGGCGAGVSTTTDNFGVFLLEGVAAYEGLANVTVEKDGYFTGSRSFVPGENAVDAISYTYITLLQKNLAGTVDGITGGTVTLEGVDITFPADAFTQNGTAYTGTVNVFLNHIDPTTDTMHTQMPGMLMGVMDGAPQLMLSYGMVGVEFTGTDGQAVQLAPGSPATVHFPVMLDQQADAPATIPLWWFDEDLGYWMQEGEADLVGNEYVGEVTHFSWWNCDVPGNFVDLKGVVLDNATGALLPGGRIVVSSQTMGNGITYTDTKGEFTGLVPVGQQLTITVQLPCGLNGSWTTVYEGSAGPYTQPSVISISVNIPDQKLVTGTVVDCDGAPVDTGYVLVYGTPYFCVNAVFELFTCAPSITLRGVDVATGNVSENVMVELINDTTDVGGLIACTPVFGTVTDIDSHTYQTVIIGNQEWMAENLRVTKYNNGDPIPHVTSNTTWSQLGSGAWCNLYNDPANDAIYGKLYNWYIVANNNVCPQGWHVPTHAEWTALTDYIGGFSVAGGKLKAVSALWNTPNVGATNETGFSGLPGGHRDGDSSDFSNLSASVPNLGLFWSASEFPNPGMGHMRFLGSNGAGIGISGYNMRSGLSLRCIRD